MTEHWTRTAERLRGFLDTAPKGARESSLSKFCADEGIGRQTLRTYLAAERTLNALPLGLRRKVRENVPATSLATAGLWMAHDRPGAIAALRAYAMGEYTIRSFAKAEAAARTSERFSSARRNARGYPAMVQGRLDTLERIKPSPDAAEWRRLSGAMRTNDADPTGKADFLLKAPNIRGAIAVLAVRPSPRDYDAESWCTWALGTAAFHGCALLVIPHDAPAEAFAEIIERLSPAKQQLYLMRDPTPAGKLPTQPTLRRA